MGRDWIIDVLADLRSFARDNDLPLLTAQLEEAGLVAEVEIASLPNKETMPVQCGPDAVHGTSAKVAPSRRS